MRLPENKVAIVTCTNTGIVRNIALLYAENGAKVVLASRNKEKNEELGEEISHKGSDSATLHISKHTFSIKLFDITDNQSA
jgi:NAD(P)-dependent dehydrogenase (short-subunit alcohol dehydrogenase family)